MILIAGGTADPNITAIVRRAAYRSVPYTTVLVGADSTPTILWDIEQDRLALNGGVVRPNAVFLRYDTFARTIDAPPAGHRRAARWYQTLLSWTLGHPAVAFFNRAYGPRHTTKPLIIHLAKQLGIAVPPTLITNDCRCIDRSRAEQWIAKPVDGGEHTRVLADAADDEAAGRQLAAAPTILQRRLVAPDLRIYRVGNRWFAFTIESTMIDYRIDERVCIRQEPVPVELVVPLGRLMDYLGLDFAAADYKRCGESGRYLFLEVNSAPMFSSFDRLLGGALADRIIDWLLAQTRST